jgi:hypothetical protein
MGRISSASHGTLRIEQMRVVGTETQPDERPRIGSHGALPSMIGLEALHRSLRGVIPNTGRTTVHVVLANERLLNIKRAL